MHPVRREMVAQTCLKNLTIRGVKAKSLDRGADGVVTSACPNGDQETMCGTQHHSGRPDWRTRTSPLSLASP
jgi:hypothetical protein